MHGSGNLWKVVACGMENVLVPQALCRKGLSVYQMRMYEVRDKKKISSSSKCGITDFEKSIWHIVRKNLQMKPYRLQLMQHLSTNSLLFFNDRMFVFLMPRDLLDLSQRITTAFANIDRSILR